MRNSNQINNTLKSILTYIYASTINDIPSYWYHRLLVLVSSTTDYYRFSCQSYRKRLKNFLLLISSLLLCLIIFIIIDCRSWMDEIFVENRIGGSLLSYRQQNITKIFLLYTLKFYYMIIKA